VDAGYGHLNDVTDLQNALIKEGNTAAALYPKMDKIKTCAVLPPNTPRKSRRPGHPLHEQYEPGQPLPPELIEAERAKVDL
jgi:hypothetical protein